MKYSENTEKEKTEKTCKFTEKILLQNVSGAPTAEQFLFFTRFFFYIEFNVKLQKKTANLQEKQKICNSTGKLFFYRIFVVNASVM